MMKDAYVKKVNAQLNEWQADIDKLKAKAEDAEADLQLEMAKDVEKLREQQDAARQRLEEIEKAGEGAWEDLKIGAEAAWLELESAIKNAGRHFR